MNHHKLRVIHPGNALHPHVRKILPDKADIRPPRLLFLLAVPVNHAATRTRRLRFFANNQARKSVHRDRLIVRLVTGRRKHPAVAILLFNTLFDLVLRQPKRLFGTRKTIHPAKHCCKSTHNPILLFPSDNRHMLARANYRAFEKPPCGIGNTPINRIPTVNEIFRGGA